MENFSFDKQCRSCLSTDADSIRNWHLLITTNRPTNKTYADVFKSIMQMQQDRTSDVSSYEAKLPQDLCGPCRKQLKALYLFIQRAKENQEILKLRYELRQRQEAQNDEVEDEEEIEFKFVDISNNDKCFDDGDESAVVSAKYEDLVTELQEAEAAEGQLVEEEEYQSREDDSVLEDSIEFFPGFDPSEEGIVDGRAPKGGSSDRLEKSRQCPDCDYSSKTASNLRRHIRAKHEESRFLCHLCSKKFKTNDSLQTHIATHTEMRERTFACTECDSKFYTRSSLCMHKKVHEKGREALWQCPECPKNFFHKNGLDSHHLNVHIAGTGAIETIDCPECPKKFIRDVDYQRHKRSHSGETPYECTKCDRKFKYVWHMNEHMRYHDGVRYKCDACGKEYLHQSSLIIHQKTHTGLPFQCGECGRRFLRLTRLRSHLFSIHKVEDYKEMESHIIKLKVMHKYRGRMVEAVT